MNKELYEEWSRFNASKQCEEIEMNDYGECIGCKFDKVCLEYSLLVVD